MARVVRCKHCRKEVDEATAANSIQCLGAVFCDMQCWRRWSRARAQAEHAEEEGDDPHA